jgi:hypothetical protein
MPLSKNESRSDRINCPACGVPMELGSVVMRDTAGGLLVFGLSYQALVFCHADEDQTSLMSSGQFVEALWCASCKVMLAQFPRAGLRGKAKWYQRDVMKLLGFRR